MDKSNLINPYANIEVGSKVMCIDGSYTMSIINKSNKLEHTYLGLSDEIFTVIAINVTVPTDVDNALEVLTKANNCIITSDSGDIHFVSSINIKVIK